MVRALTNTSYQGFNALGILFVLAWTIEMIAVNSLLLGPNILLRRMTLALVGVFLAAIDLVWRFRAQPKDSLWRFGSEFSGGSLYWIPVWVCISIMSIIGAVYWVGE